MDISMAEPEEPRVVTLKFFGKWEFFQCFAWEDPTRRIFTWSGWDMFWLMRGGGWGLGKERSQDEVKGFGREEE